MTDNLTSSPAFFLRPSSALPGGSSEHIAITCHFAGGCTSGQVASVHLGAQKVTVQCQRAGGHLRYSDTILDNMSHVNPLI